MGCTSEEDIEHFAAAAEEPEHVLAATQLALPAAMHFESSDEDSAENLEQFESVASDSDDLEDFLDQLLKFPEAVVAVALHIPVSRESLLEHLQMLVESVDIAATAGTAP